MYVYIYIYIYIYTHYTIYNNMYIYIYIYMYIYIYTYQYVRGQSMRARIRSICRRWPQNCVWGRRTNDLVLAGQSFGLAKGRVYDSGNSVQVLNTYDVPDEGLEFPWWWFGELLLPVIIKCKPYLYGQFSKCHVCFCGLDPGNLKFETVRTHKQHICF